MRKGLSLLIIISLVLVVETSVFATDADQMLGLSAMQWARGGAVVAAPTDIPVLLYNPAAIGEIGFKKIGFDLGLGILNPSRDITTPMGTTTSNSDYYLAMGNGFSARIGEKLFLGLAAGSVAGMGVDFAVNTLPDNPDTPISENTSLVTTKGLLKIVPTIAFKPTEKLTIGASLQIGYQTLALKTPGFTLPQTGTFGFGGAIGIIYHIMPKLQAGLSYTSRMNISEYEFNGTTPMAGEGKYKLDMDSPQNVAFGLAFKPMPKLLVEADVKWYNFSQIMEETELQTPAGSTIPLTFGWDDQMVYALGIDFTPKPGIIFRTGYNYGKTPIAPEDVNNNFGAIAVVEHHISIGITKMLSKAACSTISYTHGFHNEVQSNAQNMDGSYNMIEATQNIIMLQFSFRM